MSMSVQLKVFRARGRGREQDIVRERGREIARGGGSDREGMGEGRARENDREIVYV